VLVILDGGEGWANVKKTYIVHRTSILDAPLKEKHLGGKKGT